MPEEFLTVADAAERLKLNKQTIYNWIDAGTLPHVRVGRRVRIRREDFNALVGAVSSNEESENLLTVAEVAELLRLSEQTVRNWIDAGTLGHVRVGRRVGIKQSAVDAILEPASRGLLPPARTGQLTVADFWGGEPHADPVLP
jgi:excisionase family DNA binding protein